jgi:acyl-CoA synthetase (AMP-forming)/AMP-acid ligase II
MARYGLPVSQAYGIIEIGLPIINLQKSDEYPEAVGYALPAYSVAILGADYQPLPPDTPGKLAIKGPGMFDAYLSPPTLRSEVLKNGWFITGDLAICKPDGLIIICGREKNMINVSGNKVFPNEVEQVVDTYPGIVASKAYSRKHPLMGEVVALEIVVTAGQPVDNEALIQYCSKYLTGYKLPQFIYQVERIETTGSGKVRRY